MTMDSESLLDSTKSNATTGDNDSTVLSYRVSNQQIQDITVPRSAAATTSTSPDEDATALAAMQEAAAILMEADQKKRRAGEAAQKTAPGNKKKPRASSTRVPWEIRLTQLADYKKESGNLLIPIRYKKNPSLGKFVHNTREQYKLYHKQTPEGYKKKCSLTAERIQQLEEIGFIFSTQRTKKQNDDWNTRLKQLEEFKKENGHVLVPHGYVNDPSFSEWVHRQRTTYQAYLKSEIRKPNTLIEGRIEKLKGLGFNFTVHEDKWTSHWNQLKEYKEKHGDCQVPTHYTENPKLGRWVHTQRHQNRLRVKGNKSCMTRERFDMLNQLEFSWEVRPSLERPRATWSQRLEEITEFKKEHGHFKVDPISMPELNKFCLDQRYRLRLLDKNYGKDVTKRMSQERVTALSDIGFTLATELLEKIDTLGASAVVIAATSTENESVENIVEKPVPDSCTGKSVEPENAPVQV